MLTVTLSALQAGATALVLARLARGRSRRPPLQAMAGAPEASISAVIPARDESARIGPCLAGLMGDPDIREVLVVDDGSTDGTAELSRDAGARVVSAGAPPPGWVGKPWALQRGLEEARGEIVVSLDADTRPRPGLARALAAALEGAELVSVGPRFVCDTALEQCLHAALLATLVYRFGPTDATTPAAVGRLVISGQCTAARRELLLSCGGYAAAAGHFSDDVALGRALARRGHRVQFRTGGELIEVDMHDSPFGVWREWGRTIALTDVTAPTARVLDVAVVWLTLGLPPLRALTGRARSLDLALLALRWAMAPPLAGSYAGRRVAALLAPLADPLAAVRVTLSAARRPTRWRGRHYR